MKRQLRPKPAPFTVDTVETLPAACDAHDVGRVFNVSVKTVYGWHQSGRLLQAFVNGESNPLEVIRRRSA